MLSALWEKFGYGLFLIAASLKEFPAENLIPSSLINSNLLSEVTNSTPK